MAGYLGEMPLWLLALSGGIVLFAGFVKGVVGFAMPMILISGLGSILPAEVALAALILPTLVTNLVQSFRGGWRAAWGVVLRYRLYLGVMLAALVISAQFVSVMPDRLLFLLIGLPIIGFGVMQLLGLRFRLDPAHRRRDETLFGLVSGAVGGVSGIWGPPLVAYLVAIDADKREAVRVQGVVFGVGALVLALAHLRSGVLDGDTLPVSAAAVLPALIGLGLGTLLHDRLPQAGFRRAMLVVLIVAGANLVRRGVMG